MRVLVTGASGGIGSAIVRALLDCGYQVIGVYNTDDSEKYNFQNENLRYIKLDLSSQSYMEEIIPHLEGVNTFIHAAGIAIQNKFGILTESGMTRDLIQINLTSAIEISQAVTNNIISSKFGRFIFFSSITATNSVPSLSTYSASKLGLEALARVLNREFGIQKRAIDDLNFSVNVIRPGYVETKMTRETPGNIKNKINQNSTLGRFINADEIASVVLFLLKFENNFMSGSIIDVNGGQVI